MSDIPDCQDLRRKKICSSMDLQPYSFKHLVKKLSSTIMQLQICSHFNATQAVSTKEIII